MSIPVDGRKGNGLPLKFRDYHRILSDAATDRRFITHSRSQTVTRQQRPSILSARRTKPISRVPREALRVNKCAEELQFQILPEELEYHFSCEGAGLGEVETEDALGIVNSIGGSFRLLRPRSRSSFHARRIPGRSKSMPGAVMIPQLKSSNRS